LLPTQIALPTNDESVVRRFRIIELYRVFEPQGPLPVYQRNKQAHVFNKVCCT
jgi:hypothetical protein